MTRERERSAGDMRASSSHRFSTGDGGAKRDMARGCKWWAAFHLPRIDALSALPGTDCGACRKRSAGSDAEAVAFT